MAEAIQIGVFQLKNTVTEIVAGTITTHDVDIAFLHDQFIAEGYNPQKQRPHGIKSHKVYLFYKKWPSEIKWKDFVGYVADNDSEIMKLSHTTNEGFILVFEDKKSKVLYAATGGFAHVVIQKYCDDDFGLNVLSRLITAKDKVLKVAKERNVAGGILGSTKYFRGDFNLYENESFGNFYQELRAALDKNLLKNIFGFTDDEVRRGNLCVAKSSFTIKKSITFPKLLSILGQVDQLLKQKATVELSTVKKLCKGDAVLVSNLQKQLDTQLYNIFSERPSVINIELCHKEFDRYYDAVEHRVSFINGGKTTRETTEELDNYRQLVAIYKSKGVTAINLAELKKILESTKIASEDTDGKLLHGDFYSHVCCEIPYKAKSYFLLNKEWFLIKSNFVAMLNEQCGDFLSNNLIKMPSLNVWAKAFADENDFNASHIGQKDTLVFDKITPENIEVCDILKWDRDHVYFIHVKKGFDNAMRDLCRQVQISARRVQEDLKTGKTFLIAHYDKLNKLNAKTAYFTKAKAQLSTVSQTDYLKLFEKRKAVFVLAVLDTSVKKRSLSDIPKFESNIAKFCLQSLVQEMRLLNVAFHVYQLEEQ